MSLAICGIFKNESRHLVEWVTHHFVLGFDYFYLYDNGSSDGGSELLKQSALSSRINIIDWQIRPGQLQAYEHFFNNYAHGHDWVAVIDIDEFIVPLGKSSLANTLKEMDTACSAVLINWLVFGPNGHISRPDGLIVENYVTRLPAKFEVNRHVKSIIRPSHFVGVDENPHVFQLHGCTARADGAKIPNLAVQPEAFHSGLVINHYFTKSAEDWNAKLGRGKADTPDELEFGYKPEVFDHIKSNALVVDRRIQIANARLKATLQFV